MDVAYESLIYLKYNINEYSSGQKLADDETGYCTKIREILHDYPSNSEGRRASQPGNIQEDDDNDLLKKKKGSVL